MKNQDDFSPNPSLFPQVPVGWQKDTPPETARVTPNQEVLRTPEIDYQQPTQQPTTSLPQKKKRVGRKLFSISLILLLLIPLLIFGLGWWQFSRVRKIPLQETLSQNAGRGTNYLLVGTDSREGITSSTKNASAFIGESVDGIRTDTIMVLHVDGSNVSLLSLPRDLWVKYPKSQEEGRINAAYAQGPSYLVQTVQNLGIPIHHYLEISFLRFTSLVDAVGGIDVDFPLPARDENSGLYIPTAGKNHLDGVQALAYVRSRHYEELQGKTWREDPTSDLGRVARQQTFLSTLFRKMSTPNPWQLIKISGALAPGIACDDALSYPSALSLLWTLRKGGYVTETLPTTGFQTSGGASVLKLNTEEAQPILAKYK